MALSLQAKALLMYWFERHCGPAWQQSAPVRLSGWDMVTALWPLNDAFRPQFHAFRALAYSSRFEPQADLAIEQWIESGQWPPVSVETWRVLLERHAQAIVVAAVNAAAHSPMMSVPATLPENARTGAAVIWLLHGMKLPSPPADRSRFQLDAMPPHP